MFFLLYDRCTEHRCSACFPASFRLTDPAPLGQPRRGRPGVQEVPIQLSVDLVASETCRVRSAENRSGRKVWRDARFLLFFFRKVPVLEFNSKLKILNQTYSRQMKWNVSQFRVTSPAIRMNRMGHFLVILFPISRLMDNWILWILQKKFGLEMLDNFNLLLLLFFRVFLDRAYSPLSENLDELETLLNSSSTFSLPNGFFPYDHLTGWKKPSLWVRCLWPQLTSQLSTWLLRPSWVLVS